MSCGSAEHYRWGGAEAVESDGWHLVKSSELSVIEERMPPGAREVFHFHARARQFFYVLDGALLMEHGEEQHVLGIGMGLEILPGVRHRVQNRGANEVRFLVISQPQSHGDRFEET